MASDSFEGMVAWRHLQRRLVRVNGTRNYHKTANQKKVEMQVHIIRQPQDTVAWQALEWNPQEAEKEGGRTLRWTVEKELEVLDLTWEIDSITNKLSRFTFLFWKLKPILLVTIIIKGCVFWSFPIPRLIRFITIGTFISCLWRSISSQEKYSNFSKSRIHGALLVFICISKNVYCNQFVSFFRFSHSQKLIFTYSTQEIIFTITTYGMRYASSPIGS